jgi:ABC-type transport system involved in multi-copper enzyme maturation permease subunit
MRADIYRLYSGKAIYVTFAIMILFSILLVFVFRSAPQTGIIINDTELSERLETLEDEFEVVSEVFLPDRLDSMNGAVAAQIVLLTTDTLAIFFLVLICIVIMEMFSTGAIKNELSTGMNRSKLYLAKFTLSSAFSIGLMFVFFLESVFLATLFDGLGYWGDGHFANIIASFSALLLFVVALNSVGSFLGFVFRKEGTVIWLFLGVMYLPQAIVGLISMAIPSAAELLNYDLFSQVAFLSQVANITSAELARSIAICFIFIIVPTIAGITIFRRTEIK